MGTHNSVQVSKIQEKSKSKNGFMDNECTLILHPILNMHTNVSEIRNATLVILIYSTYTCTIYIHVLNYSIHMFSLLQYCMEHNDDQGCFVSGTKAICMDNDEGALVDMVVPDKSGIHVHNV